MNGSATLGTAALAMAGTTLAGILGVGCVTDSVAQGPVIAVSRSAEPALPADTVVRRDPERGTIRLLKAANLSEGLEQDGAFRALQAAHRHADVALAFVSAQRALFRLADPARELAVQSTSTDELGLTHVRLSQTFAGLPVWNAELLVHLDRANHVYLAQGRYIATPAGLGTTPRLGDDEARRIAARGVPALAPDCAGCRPELGVFVTASSQPRLAYRIMASVSPGEGWALVVDADTGAVLERLPTVIQTR